MKLGAVALERDAAALFSFVDSISHYCSNESESPSYPEPSKKFFRYIQDLGDATKEYLSTFPAKKPDDPKLYQYYRQRLETIRLGWFEFHPWIKAAADADTLNVPYALVAALTQRLNRIYGFEKTQFAIFHIDELNYWEIPLSNITKTTDKFRRYIPDFPSFSPDLGLIGIPYSQSSSLFLNCLISHEMGHLVFEKLDLRGQFLPKIEDALKEVLGPQFETTESQFLEWSKDRLTAWAEELFCDLFAVWLTGPAYSMAYIELFGLTTILDPSNASGFAVHAGAGSAIFQENHPADLLRLRQQVTLLDDLRWWSIMKPIQSHYMDVLVSSTAVTDDVFKYRRQGAPLAAETIRAFLALAHQISALLATVMKDSKGEKLDSGVESYLKFNETISAYLKRAIVPSTVFKDSEHWYPDEIAILNASAGFYLGSIEELMNSIESQKTSLPSHRSAWIKRIEALTIKAIEDHDLLVGEKGAFQVDGSFKRGNLGSFESSG